MTWHMNPNQPVDHGTIADSLIDMLPSSRLKPNANYNNLINSAQDTVEAHRRLQAQGGPDVYDGFAPSSAYGDPPNPMKDGNWNIDPARIAAISRGAGSGNRAPDVIYDDPSSLASARQYAVPYANAGNSLMQGSQQPAPPSANAQSELAQPGDPGYAQANPAFRPAPMDPGQRNAGASNVADATAAHVIAQAANARARNDPQSEQYLNQLASVAWQREAAANGNPSGDTSAPDSYVESWKGMLRNGEDTGKLGSAYQAASVNAKQRADAEMALAAREAQRQQAQAQSASMMQNAGRQAIAQTPTVTAQSDALIQGALRNNPPSASASPNATQYAERGASVTPDDMVYRGQPIRTTNYGSTASGGDDMILRAMSAGRGVNLNATANTPSAAPTAAPASLAQGQDLSTPAAAGPPPKPGGDFHEYARAVAQQYGINPDIFERQITQESGWKPNAKSGVGAQGLGQFMPETAKQYGVDVNDPYSSLDGAARYMRDNLKANNGSYRMALAAYNAGQGNVNKYGEGVFDDDFAKGQTRDYINIIMGNGAAARRGT